MKQLLRIIMTVMLALLPLTSMAQRIQQPLGRGVVVAQNGSNAMVTWRRLAQEPENTRYNVYVNGHQVNSSPLTNTNWRTTSATVPTGAKVTVTTVDAAGHESAQSVPFVVKAFDMRNIFFDINFERGGSPLTSANFNTAFVWPIDLDGDGEYDYVVNRKSNSNALDCYVEGYLRTGEHLWTVKLGPNELSCAGQDDMITVADMDCDGLGDVVIQSSDGTQFWNPDTKSFGLFVKGKTTGDTDGDGIIDYETQNVRNAPRYISVIDGMTGREKASIEQSYNAHYNRTNRASLMGDEYNKHVGHMGVCYFDGVHPGVVMEWHMRGSDGDHHYYNLGVAYDFSTGKAGQLKELFNLPAHGPAFHQIRVGDVDGDGCDEMIVGSYVMNNDGQTLFAAGIAHGDRFRTSDIDPERPGLETFAVQQNAGDMLGQVLYDAGTGEFIKKWYLGAVGDIGRGECIDIDRNHLGWEMWSTMNGSVYDAQGNLITEYGNQYPCEGIWWDEEPDREVVQTSDSHYNVYVQDFFNGREVEFAKISRWRYVTVYAKRAAFWGDIIGDWREEMILLHKESDVIVGIVGVTTDYATDINNIYCLQEDPHYRGDCSTKGYYQSPNPGFYLGFDMPRPQLPPCMVTDLIYAPTATQWSSAGFTNYERSASAAYEDGKSVLFDLKSSATCTLGSEVRPSMIYAMPVKGQTITLSGEGSIGGNGQLWKSQQGRFVVHVPLNHTGGTYISEGILEAGEIKGDVELRARGTLAGNAVVKGNLVLEGALNYEGCRLMPGVGDGNVGTIKLCKGLTVNRRLFVEADIHAAEGQTDCVVVEQGFNITEQGQLVFTIVPDQSKLSAERYMLLQYDTSDGLDLSKVSIRGLQGLSYKIVDEENALWLIVNEQREASDGVRWTGAETSLWDYQTENFELSGVATKFVANDNVAVGDDALSSTVQLNELYPVSGITFDNETKAITVQGLGGFSGRGGLLKTGKGRLLLKTVNNDYTGATIIEGGTVTVSELADGGLPSSLGAASSAATNWQIGKATLIIDNANTATNRALTLTDTATIQVNNGVTALKGQIVGSKGTLVKAGSGQLNITYAGNNTWKSTILQGGTLAMGVWNTTFGNATSPIAVTGNSTITIFNNNTTSAIPSLRNTITVNRQRTLTINGGQRCNVQGAWLGQGTVKINFPYVRGDFSTNLSQFEGILNPTSGQFRMVADIDLSKGTFQPEAGVYAVGVKAGSSDEVSRTHKIGSLVSTAADAQLGTSVWNVGYLDKSTTFAGIIGSRATLNKYGDGDLTLTGSSAGAINIYAGSISANNASVATTTATITVNSGGMLCGTGKVATVNILRGGIVGAGKATGTIVDTLTLTAPLTVSDGGIIRLRARGNASQIDKFGGEGNVVLTNPVFRIERVSGSWSVDREYKVFTGSGSITLNGTPTFEPAVPMEGYRWDYSQLASDGILRIEADPTGIEVMNNEQLTMNNSPIYDLSGRRIERSTKDEMQSTIRHPGIYIIKGRKYLVK
ncbi:MAG: hypothetical protein K5778_00055 [Bacteroidaceae bacterium]|nr:hypothetical protein [Bacteroidaceae bacterium]